MEKCSICGQTLWSAVRHCPFCAAPQAAGIAAAVPGEPEAASEPRVEASPPPRPAVAPRGAAAADATPPAPSPAPEVQPPAHPKPIEIRARKPARASARAPAPPRKRTHKLLIGLVALGTLGHWISNSTPDACDRSLALARLALQQEDARQAGQHARAAIAACEDEKRARRAKAASDDARTLLHAQARTQDRARQPPRPWVQHPRPQQAACEKSNRQTASHLSSGRLVSAGRNLQRIPQACRQLDETRALIARLDRMQATANKATADARAQLGQGAWGQARTSLQVLASVNRESDDLPELRAVLNRAQPGP